MRAIKVLFYIYIIIFCQLFADEKDAVFFDAADRFFDKIVVTGLVDYSAIQSRYSNDLSRLVTQVGDISPANLADQQTRIAFWINAYNILVINAVVQRYPLHSPQDFGGFFDTQKHRAGGELLTLNQIEKDKLLTPFNDARFHFVLVCAARGCPPIIPSAYRPQTLESQLDQQTRLALNDRKHVMLDNIGTKVSVSEIFKWYKDDFTASDETVVRYISRFRNTPIPEKFTVDYIPYDWTLNDAKDVKSKKADILQEIQNLRAYTPSTLLKRGQIEIKQFNNLYTQTAFFNDDWKSTDQNGRSTFFTAINTLLYGLNPNLNIGFDLYFKSVHNDRESSSAFSVFEFSSDERSRTTLTQIGPKLKVSPFSRFRKLSFQTTLLFPLASDLDGSESSTTPFLDFDDLQWFNQVFYDHSFSQNTLLYLETGVFFRFGSEFEDFFTPIKAILNFYPSDKTTLYLPTEFTSFWSSSGLNAFYGQLGLGAKYQVLNNTELELLYTNFLAGKNQGAGQTYNFGLRIIR